MANPLVELKRLVSRTSRISGTVLSLQDNGLVQISTSRGNKTAGRTSGLSVSVGDRVVVEDGNIYVTIRKHSKAKVYRV